jgi:hypothetical protein
MEATGRAAHTGSKVFSRQVRTREVASILNVEVSLPNRAARDVIAV